MEIRNGSSDSNSSRHESSSFDGDQMSRSMKERPNRRNSSTHYKRLKPQTTNWKKSGVPTNHGDEDNKEDQFEPGTAGRNYSPYIEEQTRPGNKNTRRRDNQQQKDQERKGGANISRTISLEIIVGDANYKS
ncbi:hypothetical protein TNCV_5053671 [Trichonephila clavipes]|nr:hypothetical protein TNCV_5053671 [Trichonephila clavipes]